MEHFTLEVPAVTVAVESRGVTVSCPLQDLPHDVLRQLLTHGVKQKVADAAASVPFSCYMESKPEGTPKPSRDQLADWVAANKKTVDVAIQAAMQKVWDALARGEWQTRVAGGTSTRFTEEQSIAIDKAKGVLHAKFLAGWKAAKGDAKPSISGFMSLSDKVAAFFKPNESRPTWNDAAVLDYITKQREAGGRDFMAEARAEIAARAEAVARVNVEDLFSDL